MKKTIFLFLLFLLFSCDKKDSFLENTSKNSKEYRIRPKEANMNCNQFLVKGQFKNSKYTFCSIVPVENNYTYKSGEWKFWNLEGKLIAKGVYEPKTITINGEGGCPYDMIEGTMNEENWSFWDENGKTIIPNEELLTHIENCAVSLRNIHQLKFHP